MGGANMALQEDYGYTNHITTYNFGISTHNLMMCSNPKGYVVCITSLLAVRGGEGRGYIS